MKKVLTHRQQQFLSQFLEIYRETGQSVHYGLVAECLGIGKVTAYEMLRLLEDRGFVQAEYQPNPDQHTPGRSVVLFYPTGSACRLMNALAGDSADLRDWTALKEEILQQLREGKPGSYEKLLSDIFNRIAGQKSPLILVTQMITAVIIMMKTLQDTPEIQALLDRLKQIGLPHKINLNVMSGIAMLLSVMERTNRHYAALLMSYFNHYEEVLLQLNQESRRRLGEFTREAVQILSS